MQKTVVMNFFNFNKKKDKPDSSNPEAALVPRLETFLDRLLTRAEDIRREIQESAQSLADADTDPYKRSFLQFKAAMIAQFTAIIQKGSTTYQTEVAPKASSMEFIAISQIFNDWHTRVLDIMTTAFDHVIERDLEGEYADIMKVYQYAKDQFQCKQCGGKLEIDRFYFTATYIACPYCRTQNTFDPGSKVRMIEHLARPLAELRCKTLYNSYQQHRQQFGAKSATEKYRTYTQALIAEMDKILPGLASQHQNFYERLMSEYQRFEHLKSAQ